MNGQGNVDMEAKYPSYVSRTGWVNAQGIIQYEVHLQAWQLAQSTWTFAMEDMLAHLVSGVSLRLPYEWELMRRLDGTLWLRRPGKEMVIVDLRTIHKYVHERMKQGMRRAAAAKEHGKT